MYIKTTSKPINEMSLQELTDEFYLIPIYNLKEDGNWSDWKGNRYFEGASYSFGCVFHYEMNKEDPAIYTIIETNERDAYWLFKKINAIIANKKAINEKVPKYLQEMFAQKNSKQNIEQITALSQYDPKRAEFSPTLYTYRSFSPLAADIYRFALYFRDSYLKHIACRIMSYPQDYNKLQKEVQDILVWFEQDDGKHIEKIKQSIIAHPKGNKAFPFLMGEIAKLIDLRSSIQ